MSQKRKGQTPRDVKQGLYKGREPILILKGWRTKPNDTGERGESNGPGTTAAEDGCTFVGRHPSKRCIRIGRF